MGITRYINVDDVTTALMGAVWSGSFGDSSPGRLALRSFVISALANATTNFYPDTVFGDSSRASQGNKNGAIIAITNALWSGLMTYSLRGMTKGVLRGLSIDYLGTMVRMMVEDATDSNIYKA